MKIYIVKGEHFAVSGVPATAHLDQQGADAAAAALVEQLRRDVLQYASSNLLDEFLDERDELATVDPIHDWRKALAVVQTARIVDVFGLKVDEIPGLEGLTDSDCDVWIEEYEAQDSPLTNSN
jgi:hypothetical protein